MSELLALADRLEHRAAKYRQWAENSAAAFGLLKPEFEKWEARTEATNLYVVRMAIEHKNNAKKDDSFADDLEAAAAALRARTSQPTNTQERG